MHVLLVVIIKDIYVNHIFWGKSCTMYHNELTVVILSAGSRIGCWVKDQTNRAIGARAPWLWHHQARKLGQGFVRARCVSLSRCPHSDGSCPSIF